MCWGGYGGGEGGALAPSAPGVCFTTIPSMYSLFLVTSMSWNFQAEIPLLTAMVCLSSLKVERLLHSRSQKWPATCSQGSPKLKCIKNPGRGGGSAPGPIAMRGQNTSLAKRPNDIALMVLLNPRRRLRRRPLQARAGHKEGTK